MTRFIVRVELHHRHEPSYTNLHQRMEAAGYRRTVPGGDGHAYQLPTAMYVRDFNDGVSATSVRDHVMSIAHQIDANPDVFVARYDDAAWHLSFASSRRVA